MLVGKGGQGWPRRKSGVETAALNTKGSNTNRGGGATARDL